MSGRRLVLVTGGSSGIGKEIARLYLQQGAQVVIVADQLAKLQAAEREFAAYGSQVAAFVCDIGRPESVAAMSERVLAEFGCPDILVNNAGFATYRPFAETVPEEIDRLASVNLVGHLRCTRAFLPEMTRRRSGAIVNVASIAGLVPISPNSVYGASKHGMVAWSETLRQELHRFGIQVVVVCPGRVQTDFFDHETFQKRQAGPETRKVVSAEAVARMTVEAVEKRKHIVYMPRWLGLMVWACNVVPFLAYPLIGAVIRRRIAEIYRRQSHARTGSAAP